MIALLRVYEAMGLVMWELEVADPDFDGKLVRIAKGSFHGGTDGDAQRARVALQQAWKYAGRSQHNRRGQLPQ